MAANNCHGSLGGWPGATAVDGVREMADLSTSDSMRQMVTKKQGKEWSQSCGPRLTMWSAKSRGNWA